MNGNSQAVRIPHEFKIDARQVEISRNADGDLIIHPVPANLGSAVLQAFEAFDDELSAVFVESLERSRENPDPTQERDPL